MSFLLLTGVNLSFAGNLPAKPDPTATVPGECRASVGVTQGTSISPSLIDESGLARCSFIAEPLSSFADLLAMESHAEHIRQLYVTDTNRLQAEVEYWQGQSQQHTPIVRQPWFVAVTTSLLVSSAWLAYNRTAPRAL